MSNCKDFKSLFIDKSLRQVVFELCSSEIKLSYKLKAMFVICGIIKDNLHLQAPTSKGIIYYAFARNFKQVSRRRKVFTISTQPNQARAPLPL